MTNYEERLKAIIREQTWLIGALETVRSLNLPDWYIAAGAIRNTVWDFLHGFKERTPLNDIDVAYFDSSDMEGVKERESESKLKIINSFIMWEVINQARGHLFQHGDEIKRPPVKSSCDSIAYWSETPTCVGVRLEQNNSLTICAPHGLSDLLELRVRPIPQPYRDLNLYKRRMQEKKWDQRWPNLNIENPLSSA